MKFDISGKFLGRSIAAMLLIVVAVLTVITIAPTGRNSGFQDVMRLETRISQLEQRIYTIETNLRNVEQQTRFGNSSARSANQEDVSRLASAIQELQRRLADNECALAKLDERTLPRETREARRKSTAGSDPCRSQVDSPLRLPNRP